MELLYILAAFVAGMLVSRICARIVRSLPDHSAMKDAGLIVFGGGGPPPPPR